MKNTVTTKNVGVVVSCSSNERLFIRAQLHELLNCGCVSKVVYSAGSHTFDGAPETVLSDLRDVISESNSARDVVHCVEYAVDTVVVKTQPYVFHNLSRVQGLEALRSLMGGNNDFWVLLLDGDEIPNGRRLDEWFNSISECLSPTVVYKLSCYWYFLDPRLRAKEFEDSIVMVHNTNIPASVLAQDPRERDALVIASRGGCIRRIMDATSQPMFHHFSWVRPRSIMLKKISTWGHKDDTSRDWESIVREYWPAGVSVYDINKLDLDTWRDPVHGYSYTLVPDEFVIINP